MPHQRYCRNTQMENLLQRKISHIQDNADGCQTHGEPLDEHVAASGGADAFQWSLRRCGLMVKPEPNVFDNVLL